MAEKIKANIYFSPDMLRALKQIGNHRGQPYAEVVRQACREYILANAMKAQREFEAMRGTG